MIGAGPQRRLRAGSESRQTPRPPSRAACPTVWPPIAATT